MSLRPCPTCRQSVPWEGNPHRPFCSERCRLRDLGAWSSEAYRIPAKPEEEQGESWGDETGEA